MTKKINPVAPVNKDLLKILSEKDVLEFEKMQAEMKDSWVKKQLFRTEVEMRLSVLNDIAHPTKAAKYWQSVREQSVMFEQMIHLSFDYRLNEVEIKKIQRKIKEEKDDLEKEKLQVTLEQKTFHRVNMEVTAKDRMRELKLWSKLKEEFVKEDPNFDTKDPNDHQKQALPERLFKTLKFFDRTNDAEGAKNIAGQVLTAQRLKKEGRLEMQGKKKLDDKTNK